MLTLNIRKLYLASHSPSESALFDQGGEEGRGKTPQQNHLKEKEIWRDM